MTAGRGERVQVTLWRSLPPAIASEVGGVAVLAGGVVAGFVAAAVALVAVTLLTGRMMPTPRLLRGALLVSGPPLRILLIAAATADAWAVRAGGPLAAVAVLLVLGLVPPALWLVVERFTRWVP